MNPIIKYRIDYMIHELELLSLGSNILEEDVEQAIKSLDRDDKMEIRKYIAIFSTNYPDSKSNLMKLKNKLIKEGIID